MDPQHITDAEIELPPPAEPPPPRRWLRVLLVAAGIVLGLALLLGGAWFGGRPAYKRWKEKRHERQAVEFMEQKDYRNAAINARLAVAQNPRNARACAIMAELSGMAKLPTELDWRVRLAEAQPTIENRLAVVTTSLRVEDAPYPMARQILEDLRATPATNNPAFHVLSARLALAVRNLAVASQHFGEAARLEPTNALHRLNLAALRVASTNAAVSAEARASLEALREHPDVGAAALSWLANDAINRQDYARAKELSDILASHPRSTSSDHINHLNLLAHLNSPEIERALALFKTQASTNATMAYELSSWLLSRGRAAETLQWLRQLPEDTRAQQSVAVAIVNCLQVLRDWRGIKDFLKDQAWNEMEFLRQAYLSLASQRLDEELASDACWRAAVREAGNRLGAMTVLASFARDWNRSRDRAELLWAILEKHPKQRWPLAELERYYASTTNTHGLNRVYGAQLRHHPDNLVVRNNFATTSLLLGVNASEAHQLAGQLYKEFPTNPIIISTYAFSLHVQARTSEALAAMKAIRPEDLAHPSLACYYGLLLAGAGQTNQAEEYFTLAMRASLLPEERELIENARHRKPPARE